MLQQKDLITLEDAKREQREHLLHSGGHAPRTVTRARMLRKAAAGWDDHASAAALSVGRAPVARLRHRFVAEGLGALAARPRPGTQPKREEQAAARLSAAAWRDAPEGRQRWTVPRLAARVVARALAASASSERGRRV